MFQIKNVQNNIKAKSKNPQIKLQNKIITIYFANTIMQNWAQINVSKYN